MSGNLSFRLIKASHPAIHPACEHGARLVPTHTPPNARL